MADQDLNFKVNVQTTGQGITNVTRDVEKLGKATDSVGQSARKASTDTAALGGGMKSLGKIASDTERGLAGLARGGIGGLIDALKSLGSVLKTIGAAMGGPLLLAIAALGAAWTAMKSVIAANEAAIAKIFDERNKQIAERKRLTEEMTSAVVKSFKEVAAAAATETNAMKALDAAMASAASRSRELTQAQNELALAKKRLSGGDTTGLETKQALAAAESTGLQAGLEKDKAAEDMRRIENQRQKAKAELAKAQHASEVADWNAERFSPANVGPEAMAFRANAAAARAAYKTAQTEYSSLDKGFTEQQASAQDRYERATNTINVSKINRETISVNARAAQNEKALGSGRTLAQVQSDIDTTSFKGGNVSGLVKERDALRSALKDNTEASKGMAKEVTYGLASTTAVLKSTSKIVRNIATNTDIKK